LGGSPRSWSVWADAHDLDIKKAGQDFP